MRLVQFFQGCDFFAITRETNYAFMVDSVHYRWTPSEPTDEQIKAAWSEVVNQYQRRADLIPNLEATVRGFAKVNPQPIVPLAP